uniref:Uncharacterized protein n=1 Tax=Arundo donax TaxID=35708 RepID=A0A0A9B3L2_ARUDO
MAALTKPVKNCGSNASRNFTSTQTIMTAVEELPKLKSCKKNVKQGNEEIN